MNAQTMDELIAHLDSLIGWPVDEAERSHYGRTDWQAGYNFAAVEAAETAKKIKALLAESSARVLNRCDL